jgi:hypothetical protein
MAADDTLIAFEAHGAFFPSSNFGTLDLTAAPVPVLEFDDTTSETVYWLGQMPGQYDGTSSFKVKIGWKFATFVGAQTCDWEVSFYRVADDLDSIEAFTFATMQGVLATEASATGEIDYADVTFTNAQADGVQPNEWFVLRLVRDASGGTASPGDAQVAGVEVRLA